MSLTPEEFVLKMLIGLEGTTLVKHSDEKCNM